MSRLGRAVAVTAMVALGAGPLAAQIRIRAAGIGQGVEHRVDAGSGLEQSSGTLYGIAVSGTVNPQIEAGLEGITGSLTSDTGRAENAKLARAEAHVAVLPMPWLALRAGLGIHTFRTPLAVQRWTTLRLGAEGRLDFVGGVVSGIARFEVYPVVSVTGLSRPNRAFGAASGLHFESGAAFGDVLYTLEHYDFPVTGGVARVEELSSLRVSLGVKLLR